MTLFNSIACVSLGCLILYGLVGAVCFDPGSAEYSTEEEFVANEWSNSVDTLAAPVTSSSDLPPRSNSEVSVGKSAATQLVEVSACLVGPSPRRWLIRVRSRHNGALWILGFWKTCWFLLQARHFPLKDRFSIPVGTCSRIGSVDHSILWSHHFHVSWSYQHTK